MGWARRCSRPKRAWRPTPISWFLWPRGRTDDDGITERVCVLLSFLQHDKENQRSVHFIQVKTISLTSKRCLEIARFATVKQPFRKHAMAVVTRTIPEASCAWNVLFDAKLLVVTFAEYGTARCTVKWRHMPVVGLVFVIIVKRKRVTVWWSDIVVTKFVVSWMWSGATNVAWTRNGNI